MSRLQVYLFGPPQIELDGRPIDVSRRKTKALLVYLAVTRTRHERETLATLLWPESDHRRAHGSLRRHLSELNRTLGDDWLDAGRNTVGLHDPASLWLDIDQFAQHVAELETHAHSTDEVCPACTASLTQAAGLYRDDLLAGFTLPDCPEFDEWQFFQADGLRQILATVLDRLVMAHMEERAAAMALPYARRRLNLDPLHEPAHQQLIRLYLETGERAAAVRQYERCVQTLEDELDVSPSEETAALYEHIRGSPSRGPVRREEASPPVRNNLPAQTTRFIGRQTELEELDRLFHDPAVRLVTVLGPGGIGKTRLVQEAAARRLERHRDGVYLVSLARISAVEHVIPAVARAIGFQFHTDDRSPKQQIQRHLRQKHMLLVLDNFEHLLDGVDLIQDLLQASPALRLWVTSRERLQLSSETVFTLGSLDFPTWETREKTDEYSAIQLFVQTARHLRPESEEDGSDNGEEPRRSSGSSHLGAGLRGLGV